MFFGLFSSRPSAAQRYVARVVEEPAAVDIRWLASAATHEDQDRAGWELRYLRRALGLLVAQRDALDDRTGSAVARELGIAMQADRHVAADRVKMAERQFNERLSAYREMIALRGMPDSPAERVARTMLLLSGCPRIEHEAVAQGAALVERWLRESEEALRAAFGDPRLPQSAAPEGAPKG
ncbi:MAG: hypothetical protein IPK85_19295 [Gemmatimonadetes bacterium]|nr:hypothetical protein [Gemmatimonadota bacterium]